MRYILKFSSLFTSIFFVPESLFPRFVEPVPNVTVTVGRDALLACVVEDLRGYKVMTQRIEEMPQAICFENR